MSTHNICFCGEIKEYLSETHLSRAVPLSWTLLTVISINDFHKMSSCFVMYILSQCPLLLKRYSSFIPQTSVRVIELTENSCHPVAKGYNSKTGNRLPSI